jgi:hypothetical protein
MQKVKFYAIITFLFSWAIANSQDENFNRVYEGSLGGFTDINYYRLKNPDLGIGLHKMKKDSQHAK